MGNIFSHVRLGRAAPLSGICTEFRSRGDFWKSLGYELRLLQMCISRRAGRRWRLTEIKSTRAQISCLCTRVLV